MFEILVFSCFFFGFFGFFGFFVFFLVFVFLLFNLRSSTLNTCRRQRSEKTLHALDELSLNSSMDSDEHDFAFIRRLFLGCLLFCVFFSLEQLYDILVVPKNEKKSVNLDLVRTSTQAILCLCPNSFF